MTEARTIFIGASVVVGEHSVGAYAGVGVDRKSLSSSTDRAKAVPLGNACTLLPCNILVTHLSPRDRVASVLRFFPCGGLGGAN